MLPALIRRLDESAIPLGGLILSEPTLDDVFLRATGARMGGVAAGEESDADGLRADGGTPDGPPSPGTPPHRDPQGGAPLDAMPVDHSNGAGEVAK